MAAEATVLLAVSIIGAAQLALGGDLGVQVRRNFAETFPLFAGGVAALWIADGFGEFSAKGAALYAVGRALYLVLSIRPLRRYRKFAWALSVAGLVGIAVQIAALAA